MITVDFKNLPAGPGVRVLDVGCGSGRHCAQAIGLVDALVVGVDWCAADLVAARDRLDFHRQLGLHRGGPYFLARADVRHLPFADGFFDVVICSEVLEHVAAQRTAAAELARVLAPAGCLVVSVPRFWPERLCWALSKDYRHSRGGHVRIYRQSSLVALFESEGLHPWAGHFAHSLHSPYWWLKCAIGLSRNSHVLVRLYHRVLVWHMLSKPKAMDLIEKALNPVLGKSLVVYFCRQRPCRRQNGFWSVMDEICGKNANEPKQRQDRNRVKARRGIK